LLVDDHAGDAGVRGGIRDGDSRKARRLDYTGAEKDEAVNGALPQQQRVFADQVFAQKMTDGEVEITAFEQRFFDAAHHAGVVTIAGVRGNDADGSALPRAERAGDEVRAVVEFLGGCKDAGASFGSEGVGQRNVVEHHRDRGKGESQMLSDFPKPGRLGRRSGALNCLSLNRLGRFTQGFDCAFVRF